MSSYRTERAAKNQTGEVSVKLYIPGKIIHLVDTTGDETTYIPYWASRYEFNQVVISGTMLSDHSMIPLPGILQDLDLDNVHKSDTLGVKSAQNADENSHFLKFMMCSYPNGWLVALLSVSSLAAFVCSFLSNTVCKFVTRETILYYQNSTSVPGIGISAGLYSYTLKQCSSQDDKCGEIGRYEKLIDSAFCQVNLMFCGYFCKHNFYQAKSSFSFTFQPYPHTFHADPYWMAARIFSIFSVILGLAGLAVISLSTCTKMKLKRWKTFFLIFVFAAVCQGLQFLVLNSTLCTVMSIQDTINGNYFAHAECR